MSVVFSYRGIAGYSKYCESDVRSNSCCKLCSRFILAIYFEFESLGLFQFDSSGYASTEIGN